MFEQKLARERLQQHNSPWPKGTKNPATGEWITNKRYIHIVEYYLALKRSEVLTPVTTQMHLENVTLSDLSQMQKVT